MSVGDSTEIELIYSAGAHKGKFNKSARLTTSDPASPGANLVLMGDAYAPTDTTSPIILDPIKLDIRPDFKGNVVRVAIKNTSKQPLTTELVSYDPAYLDLKLPKGEIKPGKSRDIEVKLLNPGQYTEVGFEKSFTIGLNDSAQTRFTVPVAFAKAQPSQPVGHSALSSPSPSQPPYETTPTKSTGLKTKSGNTIEQVEAGSRKSK